MDSGKVNVLTNHEKPMEVGQGEGRGVQKNRFLPRKRNNTRRQEEDGYEQLLFGMEVGALKVARGRGTWGTDISVCLLDSRFVVAGILL